MKDVAGASIPRACVDTRRGNTKEITLITTFL